MAFQPKSRARGANVSVASSFEDPAFPGVVPGGGFFQMPIVSTTIGEERGLIASDLLGFGREMQDPTQDVANDTGDFVVPVDVRNFGRMLKLMLGAPVTTGVAGHASGTLTLNAQPAAGSTITIGGVVFTFTAANSPGPSQIRLGSTPTDTAFFVAAALNASTNPNVQLATYNAGGAAVVATYATAGPLGNAFAIAANGAANITASAATLAGGGLATHVFTSGAQALPSMSIEVGHPEIPTYANHYGVRGSQLKIALARSGLLNATVSVIAIGEADPAGASIAGALSSLPVTRFAQASGQIGEGSDVLGTVVSADITLNNNLEAVDVIKADGRIADSDPGMFGFSANVTVKYQDTTLLNQARSGTPQSLSFGWKYGPYSLIFNAPRMFLPVPKRQVTGPTGIQAQYALQASGALAASLTATLVNDVSGYTA